MVVEVALRDDLLSNKVGSQPLFLPVLLRLLCLPRIFRSGTNITNPVK